ncbi:hypothetical protein [Paraburkholderia unamae]|uniref:Uncharacterized protein n=1 Tax=Paraburkholderia unamae TaxID=219649 RepID=A0ACC6RU41_9BURK
MTLAKFSVWNILKAQWASMRSYGSSRTNRTEVALLFVAPALLPLAQYVTDAKTLSGDVISTVVSAASIFAGLLLNLLVLLYSFVTASDSPDVTARDASTEVSLVRQTFNNVSFAIVVSVLLVVSALGTVSQHSILVRPAEIVMYYFGAMLMLLVLQILKRVHALMEFRIEVKTRAVSKKSGL